MRHRNVWRATEAQLAVVLLVCTAAAVAALPAVTQATTDLTRSPQGPADRTLAAALTVLCAVVCTVVALTLCLGPVSGLLVELGLRAAAGLPPRVLRLVLPALLGAVVTGSGVAHAGSSPPATPSDSAEPSPAQLAGLRVPDRVVGGPHHRCPGRHRVRPGESLWAIAEAWLPGRPPGAAVDREWRAIYRRNRTVIGPDPGLIHPGLLLASPADRTHSGVRR